jgi:hypothetical protein
MKNLFTITLATSILAITLSAHAAVKSHSGSMIVEHPSDLPESAQNPTNAMYLHETSAGEEILYLEQRDGKSLDVLDVTDPTQIRTVSQVTLDAPAPYDFVRDLGDSAALIRYRDNSGVAVLSFKRYKRPVLSSAPVLVNASTYESLGQTGLLVESTGTFQQPESRTAGYNIVDLSAPAHPALLANVNGVRQRMFLRDTGTLFLLNDQGLTVVRQPQVELEHATELSELSNN